MHRALVRLGADAPNEGGQCGQCDPGGPRYQARTVIRPPTPSDAGARRAQSSTALAAGPTQLLVPVGKASRLTRYAPSPALCRVRFAVITVVSNPCSINIRHETCRECARANARGRHVHGGTPLDGFPKRCGPPLGDAKACGPAGVERHDGPGQATSVWCSEGCGRAVWRSSEQCGRKSQAKHGLGLGPPQAPQKIRFGFLKGQVRILSRSRRGGGSSARFRGRARCNGEKGDGEGCI